MKKIFIVAGDPSGDIHASMLMSSLQAIDETIEFIGIGGKKMIELGLISIVPIDQMSVVGFWEVAKRYNFFKKVLARCIKIIREEKIDLFIPVDYPGFNIRLAKEVKKLNIPVVYYIAPQLWAWGSNRAKKIAGSIDLLLAVFPFEKQFFSKFGINVEFVGHPLMDDPVFAKDFIPLKNREKLLAFLPGSRKQEVLKHLPIMEKIGNEFLKLNPDFKIGISQSNTLDPEIFKNFLADKDEKWLLFSDSRDLMQKAKAGVVKTGTSNLEAALCGLPFVMIYNTSSFSYFLAKRLVNINSLSLVNILAGKKIINEYIQNDIQAVKIAEELNYLISDENKFFGLQQEFLTIKKNLGSKGASEKAAEVISKSYLNI